MSIARALAALVLTVAAVAYAAGPTGAVPEPTRDTGALRASLETIVEQRVHERDLALAAVFDAAQRHAWGTELRSERLAALGYGGDLSKLKVIRPLDGYHLSAGFGLTGPHWESIHTGLDFGAPTGTELVAVADGTVTEVAYAGPYGIRTILTLDDGTEIWYCHQLQPLVFQDQTIEIGQPIGLVGSTGNTTGPHLHLEVRPDAGAPIDPAAWLAGHGVWF